MGVPNERRPNLVSWMVVACAVTLTGLVVRRELFPPRAEPVRQEVAAWRSFAEGGRRIAEATSPVTVVVFSDFQCPACRVLAEHLQAIRARHPRDVAIVYRHFPITTLHPFAMRAGRASECAARQGRFEAYHDALFRRQEQIADSIWMSVAREARIRDLASFGGCMQEPGAMPAIERDIAAARQLGVNVTPTVLINGLRLDGTPPLAELERYVERAIKAE